MVYFEMYTVLLALLARIAISKKQARFYYSILGGHLVERANAVDERIVFEPRNARVCVSR